MTQARPPQRVQDPSRRRALLLSAGLSLTLLGDAALAQAQAAPAFGRRKLVVIICRGAMDGLSVAPPVDDRDYAGLRGQIAIPAEAALKLNDGFALHPKLVNLHALALAGQARIAPAVAIPQRIRSHFEAQDLLETGGAQLYETATGWLNRTLSAVQPRGSVTALSVGPQEPLILRGPVQAQSWSPGGRSDAQTGRLATVLQDLYRSDAVLGPAFASGLQTQAQAMTFTEGASPNRADVRAFATTAARFLTTPGGPSIAVLSLDGFDTHARQGAVEGLLATRLNTLDQVIDGLHAGMGSAWKDTAVVVATEFGRTARVNGTGGTDHGTASTMILAGGALKAGGIVGDWPTLAANRLFEDRDLAPTLDIRSVFKGVLADHLGIDRRALDGSVFPDSAVAAPVGGLIAA